MCHCFLLLLLTQLVTKLTKNLHSLTLLLDIHVMWEQEYIIIVNMKLFLGKLCITHYTTHPHDINFSPQVSCHHSDTSRYNVCGCELNISIFYKLSFQNVFLKIFCWNIWEMDMWLWYKDYNEHCQTVHPSSYNRPYRHHYLYYHYRHCGRRRGK